MIDKDDWWDGLLCAACGNEDCQGECPWYARYESNVRSWEQGMPTRPLTDDWGEPCWRCRRPACDGLCDIRCKTKPTHFDRIPSWTDYLLGLAFVARLRSKDPNTAHGCVITDRDNRILGIGYNNPPSGMEDCTLPYNRPTTDDPEEDSKYDWMVHSEPNALANTTFPLHYVPGGAVAYITGMPCNYCSMLLAQNGVRKLVIANRKGWLKENSKTKRNFEILTRQRNIEVVYASPDLSWLTNGHDELYELGFLPRFRDWLDKFLTKLGLIIIGQGII